MSVTEGLFTFSGYVDLAAEYTSRLSAIIDAVGVNPNNVISGWVHLSEVLSLSGADPSQWSVRLEERHTSDDPAGSPTWSEWSAFQVGALTARAFQFRLWLFSLGGGISPEVTSVTITIDMPDRIIAEQNLVSGTAAGGFHVTFNPFFHSLKSVVPAGVDMANDDKWEFVGAPNEAGFTIRFKNVGGTVISRTFNHHSVGYGSEIP